MLSLLTAAVLVSGTAAVSSSAANEQGNSGNSGTAELPQLSEDTVTVLEESKLPVVYMNSDTRANMVNKVRYTEAEITITDEAAASEQLYSGRAYLRLRGNSTAGLTKKPYKLKLETGADLFGMGKSKHWVLLANAIDLTNLRNYMLQTLAGKLGMDSMQSKLVSLVWNGTYMGVYELCEQVRIGKTRVDIYDWEDLAEDVAEAVVRKYIDSGALRESDFEGKTEAVEEKLKQDYCWVTDPAHEVTFEYLGGDTVRLCDIIDFDEVPAATGGVLMEMDFYAGTNADLRTAYKLPVYMSFPAYDETAFTALEDYMREYVQCMEYAMHSTDFTFRNADAHFANSGEGRYDWRLGARTGTKCKPVQFSSDSYDNWHYTDFADIDSIINNMLVCEVSDNWDSMKNSFFMYKDIDSKIKFGPAWDFDWAWGNSMYGIDTAGARGGEYLYAGQWQTTNDWFANEQYYQTQQFNRLLIRDPYFVVKLYERYREVRDEILALPESFRTLSEQFGTAFGYNYERWINTDSCGGLAGYTYSNQYKNTERFLTERVEWLDAQFESLEKLMSSLNAYRPSDRIEITGIDTDTDGFSTVTASVTEPLAVKVSFQVNGKYFYSADVVNCTATVRIPDEATAGEKGKLSVVQARAVSADGAYVKNVLGTETGVYLNAVSNYAVFTKKANSKTEASGDSSTTASDGTEEGAYSDKLERNDSFGEKAGADKLEKGNQSSGPDIGTWAVIGILVLCTAAFVIYKKKSGSV